ncbi:MAG: hypothetical protein E3J35_03885 [Methanomassiliicoccales archaeon]|nr:MAG: hypothetical protein E3J35_03885 [Methanomassiliicoccales archaeon]
MMSPRAKKALLTLALCQLFLLVVAASSVAGDTYPSPTWRNEESILVEGTWNLFASVDGFLNSPNAEGGEDSAIGIQWDDSTGNSHLVLLESIRIPDSQDYSVRVTIVYAKYNVTGIELFNKTVSTNHFESRGLDYYLTAFVDENETTHIFWERSYAMEDVPQKYWLFHEHIDREGEVKTSAELFYYEKRGSYLVLEPPFLLYALIVVIPIVAVVTITVLVRRKREDL